MKQRWLIVLSGLMLFLSGCLYNARERADQAVCSLALHPYDQQPASSPDSKPKTPASPSPEKKSPSYPPLDEQTSALTAPGANATGLAPDAAALAGNNQRPQAKEKPRLEPPIPPEVPGSETPRLPGKAPPEYLQKIYPDLPPLLQDPVPLPGPNGKPYTLSDLHQIAATNSPTLPQAAFDVETARGNRDDARAYPNPTIGWNVTPSNDGSTAGAQGPFIDQRIVTGGKLKHAGAAAEMNLLNAELALRRARSDLATQVRNAYFAVLVAKEAVRVNKALAGFTDQMFRLQASGLLRGGFSAPYEPSALRAQAYSVRLAYNQSVQAYIYAWEQLVAAIGLRHLPLTEVAGRVDAFIPYYDYDTVRAHVLRNHTDVLTARNGISKANYLLELARVTPLPDVDINASFLKEYSLFPKQFVHTVTIGLPFPIWNRNRGGIIAAEGALGRALEEPHHVEENLTITLSTAYMNYMQNLKALEYYRRYILPDQVRYYRGVVDRRQFDQTGAVTFSDLVTAQQTFVTNVSTYLTTLGALWSSVVSVADLLQTDDLFQFGQPRSVPPLPDLDSLLPWPCCHECPPVAAGQPSGPCTPTQAPMTGISHSNGLQDYFQKPPAVKDVKDVKTTNTPFEESGHATPPDSGHAIQPNNMLKADTTDNLSNFGSQQSAVPIQEDSHGKLPRRLPSFEIRQRPYPNERSLTDLPPPPTQKTQHADSNEPSLLELPPPIPYVPDKKQMETMNLR